MPSENLLLTFRRKFSQRILALFDGQARPTVPTPVSKSCPIESEYSRKLRQLVEAHLAEAHFSVNALCHKCHTCQSQLYRKLKAHTGLSPVRFINAVRLQKAKELLLQTDLSIAEVAYETGFTSPTYFSRLFVKIFGMTPSEYRKNGSKSRDE